MKKFLVILMVVAMASFLFVGCVPTTPAEEEVVVPEEVPVVAKTDTPIITLINGAQFDVSSTATQRINDFNVVVVAPVGSVLKLYVNDVWVGTGSAGAGGVSAAITTIATIADGVKTIYVTAQASGLAVSEKSTIYTATLDTVAPKIASAVADSSANTITVTFDSPVVTTAAGATSARLLANYEIAGAAFTAGTITKVSSTVVLITAPAPAVAAAPAVFILACANIADTLGNAMAATFTETYVGVTTP